MKYKGICSVLLAGTLWGAMGVFVRKMNAYGIQTLEITQFRVTFALLVLGTYLLLFQRQMLKIRLKDIWCFLGTGIVSMLFCTVCYFQSMSYVSLSTAGVLLYTAPIFVMLMSIPLFRERITPAKVLALVLSFAGCALVSGAGSGSGGSITGILLGLGSGLFYALYSIFSRYAINRGYHSWTITFYTFFFGTIGCSFMVDWQVIGVAVAGADVTFWAWAVGIGVITGFLPYLFFSKGLEAMESSKASIVASVEPVVGTLFGVFLFHEPLGLPAIIGIALVLGAICALSLLEKR